MELDEAAPSSGSRVSTILSGADTLMPFGLRALLHLTTGRWDTGRDVHPELGRRIEAMRADGWWVRTALPRNYVLWRHGRTMRDPRRPVLVLPQSRRSVSTLSWNVFLAVEIVRAKERLQRAARPDLSTLAMAEISDLVGHLAAGSAVHVTDPLRLHREAAARLKEASAP